MKHRPNIALHGATVALTPARAVTSHLRKRYREKYHGQYKYAPLVFAFDLAVFGVAAVLVALNIVVYVSLPPEAPSVGLVFSAAPIKSAAPQALIAEVEARGKASNDQIILQWNLPAGTEILSADPPLNKRSEATLGKLEVGDKAASRLVVRFYAPQGSLRFGFKVQDGQNVLSGYENRQVEGSALLVKPLFEGAALSDGRIPMRIANASDRELAGITLVGFESVAIDSLAPDQDRIEFTRSGRVSVLMQAYPLVEQEVSPTAVDAQAKVSLLPSTGNTAKLDVETPSAGSVYVYHPGLAHPHVKTFDVPSGRTTLSIPLERPADNSVWYAAAKTARGWSTVAESRVTTPFQVDAAIRYYASTGDQIGIGPLPPRVGEETRYWVQTSISPTTKDISDLAVRIRLPKGVRHTGRHALPSGGGLSESDGEIVWSLGYLAASSEGAAIRFEIALTPDASMLGDSPLLIESIQAEALEIASGIKLESVAGAMDTSLPEDERAKGRGIVE